MICFMPLQRINQNYCKILKAIVQESPEVSPTLLTDYGVEQQSRRESNWHLNIDQYKHVLITTAMTPYHY